jgi:hypothetical protein
MVRTRKARRRERMVRVSHRRAITVKTRVKGFRPRMVKKMAKINVTMVRTSM